jgi:TonB family protein
MKMSRAYAPLMAFKAAPAELEDKTLREQTRQKEEDKRRIALRDVTVSEGLSQEAVLNVIKKKIIELEKYFPGSEPGAKLVLRLTLSPYGKVKNVKAVSSSLKNGRFQRDIIEQVKKWQFPATQEGREAKVTISLVFGS